MTKYILYLAEQGNFQSRSMLISYDEFIKSCKEDYDILKRCSTQNVKLPIDGTEYIIDNLLTTEYPDGGGALIVTEYSDITSALTHYAQEGPTRLVWGRERDEEWLSKSKFNLCNGFNHIQNYLNLKNKYDIEEGFLVLESRNGRVRVKPPFETAQEMYDELYS